MRRLLTIVGVLLLIVVLVAVGVVLRLRHIKPNYDHDVTEAVSKPVEVWRDSAGVPHIWATTDHDLYFAQGYVHAQERLWEMELFRRVAEGRLSEVLGERML